MELKDRQIDVQPNLNLLYTEDISMAYLFCSIPKIIWTIHKKSKFPFGFKQNNSYFFLDVKVTHGSNGFPASVFRKAKFSGAFTNFDSFIFESYNTNLIFTLLLRCFTICSDMQSFDLEVEQLRHIFKWNNCWFKRPAC